MKQILFFLMLYSFASTAFSKMSLNATNAIYGKDKRQFIGPQTPAKIRALSSAVALIIPKDTIQKSLLETIVRADLIHSKDGANLCRDEKFGESRHGISSCTGFLISEDLFVSAGHCFRDEQECQDKVIVFDVHSETETSNGFRVPTKSVFECSHIESMEYSPEEGRDFAVVRLKEKAKGRTALKLSKKSISNKAKVFMIGHPLGLPLMVTNSASIVDNSDLRFFAASLNSFYGNSGSPVFNEKTLEVEGILVKGQEDLIEDSNQQCYRYKVYDQMPNESIGSYGEGVTRISEIGPYN